MELIYKRKGVPKRPNPAECLSFKVEFYQTFIQIGIQTFPSVICLYILSFMELKFMTKIKNLCYICHIWYQVPIGFFIFIFDASKFATIESTKLTKLYSSINSNFRLKNIKNSVEAFGIPGKIVQRFLRSVSVARYWTTPRPTSNDINRHQSGCLMLFFDKKI